MLSQLWPLLCSDSGLRRSTRRSLCREKPRDAERAAFCFAFMPEDIMKRKIFCGVMR